MLICLTQNNKVCLHFICYIVQGCHIWVGSKFPDISLTIPWHIAIFPWQFILFFQVKNKNYPQKQFKGPIFVLNIFATKELM